MYDQILMQISRLVGMQTKNNILRSWGGLDVLFTTGI